MIDLDGKLNQEQEDSLLPVLNTLEEHYIKVRKHLVNELQEIDNQIETFKGNKMVMDGLSYVRSRTQQSLSYLESSYKENLLRMESYNFRMYAIADGHHW